MKHINLTQMLQGCSKRNGMTVRASNPDGEPTVNRQSRLMSLSGKKAEKEQLSPSCLLSASFPLSFRSRYLRYAAVIFCVLAMSVGQMWGAVGTSASTTFTCGTTSTSGVAYAYTFNSNAANSDTIVFHAASIYSSSVTYAYYQTGAPATSNNDFAPLIYKAVTGGSQTSSKGIYSASASASPSELRVQSGKILWVKVTNCTSVLLSGKSGGSRTTNLDVYLASNTSTPITNGSKTIGNTANTVEVPGMSASNTYLIKISGSETSNCAVYELALVYPHASGGGCSAPTSPNISGTTAYTAGQNISLTASATGTSASTTYTWYKGATWDAASETTPVQAASTSGATFTKASCVTDDAGTYWCNISNGTGCEVQTSKTITVSAGGGGTTVTATWPMYSESSLSLVGTASNSSITPSNAVATFPSNIAWGAVATVTYTDYTGKMVKITENNTSNITGDNSSISYTTYVKYSLTVATGYTFKPTGFSARIGRQGTDNGCAKVVLKKGTTGIDSTTISKPARDNASTLVASTTYSKLISDADTYEAGDVIDLYVYLGGKMKGKSFVISDVSITGEYAEAVTPSCTAPSSVPISGDYAYLGGQTISLTATPTGHTGTPQYQWQKETSTDVWENITGATSATFTKSNCGYGDSGNYRCVVSTGATCSTTSPGYGVHVYSLSGGYVGEDWEQHDLTFQSGTTGMATVHLNAGSLYKFKITSNNGKWYGNGTADYNGDGNADDTDDGWYTLGNISEWTFNESGKNFRLYTGIEGDYTFTVDVENGMSGSVKVSVTYPTPTSHPAAGLAYFEKPFEWTNVYLYWYGDDSYRLTNWDGAPEITATTSICGTTYYYTPLGTSFGNVIFKGNDGNKWTSISTSGCSGKYLDKTTYASPAWASFTTYTITTAASPAGYGTVSAASVSSVACGTSISASTNTLTVGATNVTATPADATAEYTYAFDSWSWSPSGASVTSNVTATANFTRTARTYTVTLNTNGGTINADNVENYTYGTGATLPTNVTKDGHRFMGWYDNEGFTGSAVTTIANDATGNKTYWAKWAQVYTITNGAPANGTITISKSSAIEGEAVTISVEANTGYTFNAWNIYKTSDAGTTVSPAAASASTSFTMPAYNVTVDATFNAKTTTITINANTSYHGSTAPSPITATYGSALPSFTAAAGASGYSLTGYFTEATSGTKVINADGTLVAGTDYADGSGNWKYETASLTLYAQYEEEVVSPSKCITFNSTSAPSVSGVTIKKVAGGEGGSTYTASGFVMSQKNDYITFDISALGNLTKATFTAKTNSASKRIGYGYTDGTTYVGEVPSEGTADTEFHEYEITSIPDNTTRFTLVRRGIGTTITEVCLFYTPISCSTPATPTAFSAESITSTGATFNITDAGDAASYDIYYSTSNTAPNASTPATTTSTSKTKAVTGLTASTTYYAWVRSVCDADHKSAWVALSGSSFETSAAAITGSTSVNIEQGVLTNSKNWSYTSALTSANITYDLSSGCELDSLNDDCSKTDRNNNYLGLKIKSSGKYIQVTLPADKTLKVRFGYRAAVVKVWIDEVAQTDIPITDTYYDYELPSSGSNRTVKIATSTDGAVVIKQIMIGEAIASVTLPAKISLGSTTDGTISVASTKVNVGSTVTVTATPSSGYELATLTYKKDCPTDFTPVDIKDAEEFTMPNGNVTINATFAASCTAHGLAYASTSVDKNVGDAAFTNTLTNPNSLSVSYSSSETGVATVNATSGLVSIVGAGSTTITATWAGNATYCAGTATYTLTVSSDCTPQSLVKTQLTSVNAGTTTGYNDGQYAGDPVIATFEDTKVDGGYKLKSNSKLFVTLKGGFVADDKINIVVTKASDLTNVGKLLIFYDASTPKLLTTIDAASAGTYTYTLTDDDITTLGSTTTIGVYRPSSGDEVSNPLVKSVEVEGCREWAVCTAPDAVAAGSVTGEGATFTITDEENTNNYEIYYSTSSTAPTAETSAIVSGISSKSRAVTGLEAETTYYYWVRSNCGGTTKSSWVAGTPTSFTTSAAAATHKVTYNGNGSTGGSVPTDATAYEEGDVVTVLGNTGSLVKTGQTFLGWSTNATASSGTFYPAGYKFEMPAAAVNLYAVWGSTGATCVTITDFETGSHDKSSGKPDSEGKYFYGYKGTKSATYAVTITTINTGTVGVNSGDNLQMAQNTRFNIYADNTTTSGTPATFSSITSISFKIKAVKNTKIPTIDVYVGSTNIKTVTGGDESKSDGHEYDTSGFTTITVSGLSNLSGIVKFVNTSSGSSDYKALFDDIQICYGSGAASGFTVSFNMNGHGSAIADIENVPSGSMISAPIPSPTAVGVEFGGWYNEAGCSSVWNFATGTITADKTLYAKWTTCAPSISGQLSGNTYTQGAAATALSVTASGEDLNYQWYTSENDDVDISGSSAIPGATSASYTPSTSLLGTIYYFCVVSNTCGNAISNKAAITVNDSKPAPKANWTIGEPTHGGKGFSFSVEVNKDDNDNWDGTLEASMLTLSSEAVLDESSIVVDNTNKTISGTYGVKASATSPVTFFLLLPATETQAAARLDHDRSFTACGGSDGTSYNIHVRKAYTKGGPGNNYYYWDNPDGWISSNTASSISSGKSGTVIAPFDTIGSSNTQNVWVRTYHANIKKVRIYAQFRADNMTVNNVYKHSDFLSADSKYIVAYTAVYNDDADATDLGDADSFGHVDITLEEPMNANDVLLVKFSTDRVRPLGAVLTEGLSDGSLNTSLVWSNSDAIAGMVNKYEGDADFSITATRGGTYEDNTNASLGAISYSSSVPGVATVDAATGKIHIVAAGTTVIKATLAASGCYKKAEITYSLVVAEYVCAEKAGTVRIKTDNGCTNKILTVTGFEEGATGFQWYKDGEVITGETSQDYTATESGTYSVSTQKTCAVMSANSITLTFAAATATKIVDSWYIKNGRRTPDIALVQTTNATGFTVTTGSPASDITSTGIGGCTFELKEDGIIYLHGTTSTGAAPSGMTPGDMTITITATACSNATPLDIVLHIQPETAKPSIAFVVDGTLRKDGGTATSVLAAKTSERPIWKYLANSFALTGCNAYWSVDSKELRQYYSQFDAILITDDPSTTTTGTGGVSYVKALGTMVDVRPVLTLEAYVGKFKDGGWHVYDATPSSPNPRQVELKLECKNHDIFKGLNPETSDNVRTTTDALGNENWHVIMVDTTVAPYHNTSKNYKDLPALQGFDKTKFDHMLGVGTIAEETLQAGVERQEEPAARMMILGIQNEAMAALTNEGKLIIKNAIEYLLKTNMEDVNDCANYFTGGPSGTGDDWATAENWSNGKVPDFESRVRILRPVVISGGTKAIVARVDIATKGKSKWIDGECNGKVTVNSQGALIVSGKIRRAEAPRFGIDDLMPTENDDLIVKAATDTHKQGALIFDNSDGDTHAVVEMWNPSYWEVEGGKKKKYWSYVAVPIQEADIPNFFWDGFTYLYDETSGWIRKGDGTSLYPFQGIGASLQDGNMETFYGPLATTESQDITLTVTAGKGEGMNLIGNSWTAPIQIANFDEDDFGDAAAEIWVFNTGNTNAGHTTMTDGSSGTTTAGQWQTIPIGVAGLPGYTGLKVIPAMQAFEVNTESETTLHLDYDRLVRAGRENLNEPMRAPRRSAAKQIEATMRVRVSGELTHTDVYLLKDARFSDGFDNGWDGHFLSGDNRSAQLYAISEAEGELAFLAQPEIEGTQLGFAPSKHGNEYTFSFSYDGDEEYYLNDIKLQKSTQIDAENKYLFTYEEGDTNRFFISRQPLGVPEVATGNDAVKEDIKAIKIIYNDKLYIIRAGRVYSAEGILVK